MHGFNQTWLSWTCFTDKALLDMMDRFLICQLKVTFIMYLYGSTFHRYAHVHCICQVCTCSSGFDTETEFCHSWNVNCLTNPCCFLVPGDWMAWGEWGACTVTCGGGTRFRSRVCDMDSYGNLTIDCIGDANETGICHDFACSPGIFIIANVLLNITVETLMIFELLSVPRIIFSFSTKLSVAKASWI